MGTTAKVMDDTALLEYATTAMVTDRVCGKLARIIFQCRGCDQVTLCRILAARLLPAACVIR